MSKEIVERCQQEFSEFEWDVVAQLVLSIFGPFSFVPLRESS